MARRKIPLKDKEKVKRALAKGKSTREAIKGTSIKSNKTAANIEKREIHDITRKREEYVKLIEKNGASFKQRAKRWGEMSNAEKIHTSHTEPDQLVPDWNAREKALKYIDTIANIHQEKGVQVAVGVKFISPQFRGEYEE